MIRKPSGIEIKSRFQLMQRFHGKPSLEKNSGFPVQPGAGKRGQKELHHFPAKQNHQDIGRSETKRRIDNIWIDDYAEPCEQAGTNSRLAPRPNPQPTCSISRAHTYT